MNVFFRKSNQILNKLLLILVITISVGLFLWFTSIQETKIKDYYIEYYYYDEAMQNQKVEETKNFVYQSEEIKNDYIQRIEKETNLQLNYFRSFLSNDQTFFLEAEIEHQYLNQELVDEFNGLNYDKYNSGKINLNKYLLQHHLRLKSLVYSTDSAIFTMNVLEFLNTPLFFLCFFLLTPIVYFKKYEDGRIRFLLTQPISRNRIIWEDYQLFLKNVGRILALVTIISFALSFIVSREVTLMYPVQLTCFSATRIIPIYQYLLILCVTFFFVATFLFFLTYACLLLCKKVMLALFLTIFICLASNILITSYPHFLAGFNPFSYTDVEKVAKSTDVSSDIKYVMQSDQHIGLVDQDFLIGNVVENPYYFANDSLATQTRTVDIVLLPIILSLYIFGLIGLCIYLLHHYKV